MLKRLIANGKSRVDAMHSHAASSATAAMHEHVAATGQMPASKGSSLPIKNTRAPIVGVLGAKGGAGATTLAVNIASALSRRLATTLIDANFQQPDAGHVVNVEPAHSLLTLIDRGSDVDEQLVQSCSRPANGAHLSFGLLLPPMDGVAAVNTNLSELAHTLSFIRTFSDCWVVDLPRHLDKHLVTMMDMCDVILLVFEATVSGVAACQRWLTIFTELGYEQERIICVLNRSSGKYADVERQLPTLFGTRTIMRIPNASAINWECSTAGTIAVMRHPNHPFARAVYELAERLYHLPQRGKTNG